MTLEVPGYVELARLGEDAAGTVMLARHPATGAVAAIRHLSLQLVRDREFLERFRGEAPILQRLRHANLAGLHVLVEGGGEATVVTELVDGVSLDEMLRQFGAAEPRVALVVLLDTLRAMQYLHAAGVLHRDCKPENLVVGGDGVARLGGAGMAVSSAATQLRPGTAAYMAPELWAEGLVSPASDAYAASATFFHCLTGRPPFRAGDVAALRLEHEESPIPAWEVPEALRELVQRGLDKDPARRSAGAPVLLAALAAAAEGAYGLDWEERGRRRLAAMALSLSALFPLAMYASLLAESGAAPGVAAPVAPVAPGADDGGERRRWLGVPLGPAAALAGVLLLFVFAVGGMALTHSGWFARSHGATALGTPSASPRVAASPGVNASASASPGSTASPSPSPPATSSPTARPTASPSATARTSATPSAAPPALAVEAVSLPASLGHGGNNPYMTRCDATAVAQVTSNGGAGSITVSFAWSYVTSGSSQPVSLPLQTQTVNATSGQTTYASPDTVTVPANATKVFLTVTAGGRSAGGSVATPQGCH
jgi:serine/threonine-protein kinase